MKINPAIMNLFYPVGTYYETSDNSFDPNVVWGGTWVLEEDGTVLVSKSSTSGSLFNDSIGSIVGEEKHTLTVNEMPSHAHQADYSSSSGVGIGITAMGNKLGTSTLIKSAGGGQAHNIVQPSKICYRWHRTA